jgi:hypothetical protein
MNPSGRHPRRLRWPCLALALLLLAGWTGFHLAERTSHRSAGVAGAQPATNSTALTNGSRAAARLPQANASARTVFHTNAPRSRLAPALGVSVAVVAPTPPSPPPSLRFNGHEFKFDPDAPAALAECQRRMGEESNIVALVGLTVKPSSKLREALASRGIDLLDYVPDNGWIARIHGTPEPSLDPRLFHFRPLDASLRIQAGWPERTTGRSDVPVYLHVVRDRPATGLLEALVGGGFERLTAVSVGDRTHLAGTIAAQRLPEFLRLASTHPDTLRIERGQRARLLNATAARTTQSGSYSGTTPFFERGIFGAGQVIAVCDTGIDVDSCFFRDPENQPPPMNRLGDLNVDETTRKVMATTFLDPVDDPGNPLAWDNHGHGTSVAGTAAGSSLYEPWDPDANNGMAPGARLIIQDAGYRPLDDCAELPGLGCPVTNYYPALLQAAAQGATVHNNSWGDQEGVFDQNIYTEACRELDLMTWSNKQFLIVCAAGNNAFNDTVGSPSTAKNGLSVAASLSGLSEGRVASYSSRGWASDGRFKPDVTAPGHNLRTAASDGDITTGNCYTTTQSGTSFAAPVVSGLAALVRDYFAQGFYPSGNPVTSHRWPDVSAALVKAVLINAAAPMSGATAPPPSRDQGWGLVNLSQTLRLASNQPALLAVDESPGFAAAPAFPFKTYLRLTATNQPLKVTLVWSDYPATPGADRHLVNDLDLRVRTPQVAMKGNRMSDGHSVTGGDYDRLNNVEQVEWTPDQPAIVEISVWAHQIVVGPQDFAIVATGDFTTISPEEDEDEDGLPDYWELWHFGHLSPQPGDDADADGASNAAEFAANTDPSDATSLAHLDIVSVAPDGLTLDLRVSEGRQYVLERRNGSSPADSWSAVSEPILIGDPIGEGSLHFITQAPAQETDEPGPWFYRVRVDASP